MRLELESLAYKGPAVAHGEDGRVVFVNGGCPGDIVEAQVIADKGRYVDARVSAVIEASSSRVEAPCPYFGECGGCQWQHVAYPEQLAAKTRIVADTMERIGGLGGAPVAECVASPAQYGYRNRIELAVAQGRGLRLGYHRAGGDDVLPVKTCMLPPERLWKSPGALSGALGYALKQPQGVFRVAVKAALGTGDVEVDLWGTPGPFPRQAASRTVSDALGANTVTRVLAKEARERSSVKVEVLSGQGAWRESLGGFEFLVSAPSFFQTNTAVAASLVTAVLEALAPDGTDRVLDLYSGVGTFTLPLAEVAGEVVAVEGQGSAVRDLRRNLERASLDAVVLPGDAARALEGEGTFTSAVVDPPREGLAAAALDALAAASPRRIAYVSCDPATLARDASALAAHGYRLRSVTPFDMFPQTYHVEALAVLDLERG